LSAIRKTEMTILSDPSDWLDRWETFARGDSLELSFNDGFGGVLVRAAMRGDEFRGGDCSWIDAASWPREGRVRGVRISSPAGEGAP